MHTWTAENGRGPYLTYADLSRDSIDFASAIAGKGYTGIVGVPRSGLIAASQVAVFLGLPLLTLNPAGRVQTVGGGLRMKKKAAVLPSNKKLLVLEDSCASGRSMRNVKDKLKHDNRTVEYGAIYATPHTTDLLDVWHKELPLPHWFEWNWPGNWYFNAHLGLGCDWDGILNRDFTAEEDDDGDLYIKTMMDMTPSLVVSPIKLGFIVTARLEKYRSYCEYWLKRNGMQVDKLIMGPWATKEERAGRCMGSWKADMLEEHGVGLYIESCPAQARVISRRRDTPVICPVLGKSLVRGV